MSLRNTRANQVGSDKHALPILWLAVRPFGNVRRYPFENEFADQIRHSIRSRARQTVEND